MDTLRKTWRMESALANSDEHAFSIAREMARSSPMELWCGPRLVKVAPGQRAAPAAAFAV
jgi:hypothetical protein